MANKPILRFKTISLYYILYETSPLTLSWLSEQLNSSSSLSFAMPGGTFFSRLPLTSTRTSCSHVEISGGNFFIKLLSQINSIILSLSSSFLTTCSGTTYSNYKQVKPAAIINKYNLQQL